MIGAPVAMEIGGAASGAIMIGYDAYSSVQRGWALVGSIAKGAGLGAITGFVGGQFIGTERFQILRTQLYSLKLGVIKTL